MPQIALAPSPKTGKYLKRKWGQGQNINQYFPVWFSIKYLLVFFTILLGGAQETINSCKSTPLSLNPKHF